MPIDKAQKKIPRRGVLSKRGTSSKMFNLNATTIFHQASGRFATHELGAF
jgi:hypothetical protein